MLEIECAGERLVLLPEKCVYWPRKECLIVADLHLGKSAAFRSGGIAVPESTTAADLDRLGKVVRETGARKVVILGDFFHARRGQQVEVMDAIGGWCAEHQQIEISLVPGNHDARSEAPPPSWNIRILPEGGVEPPFAFCHEPQAVQGNYMLSGHIHPAISLSERHGSRVRLPCFWFGADRAVLPAFGSFTGLHVIKPCAGERIFVLGQGQVIALA